MMTQEELIARGYRVTSRKFRHATRIDRPDWKEYLAKQHAPWDIEEGRAWVEAIGAGGAADYYRRCVSSDTLILSEEVAKGFPTSCHDPIGYVWSI